MIQYTDRGMIMVINLLSEKELNQFLTKLVYENTEILPMPNIRGEYESVDYIREHKDSIIKGILNQWVKLRLRQHTAILGKEPGFVKIDKNRSDLPDWCNTTFNRGEDIYEFYPKKVSNNLRSEIMSARDYLYGIVGNYIDTVVDNSKATNVLPRISYGWLKDKEEYGSFEKVLALSNKEIKKTKMKSASLRLKQKMDGFKQFFLSFSNQKDNS